MSAAPTVTNEAVTAAVATWMQRKTECPGEGARPRLEAVLNAAVPLCHFPATLVPASIDGTAALHEAAAHLRRLNGQVSALGTDRKATADWLDELAGRRG